MLACSPDRPGTRAGTTGGSGTSTGTERGARTGTGTGITGTASATGSGTGRRGTASGTRTAGTGAGVTGDRRDAREESGVIQARVDIWEDYHSHGAMHGQRCQGGQKGSVIDWVEGHRMWQWKRNYVLFFLPDYMLTMPPLLGEGPDASPGKLQ